MSEMRQSFLKGYIMSLVTSGEFTDMRPTAMVRKALSIAAQDLPAVLKEIAGTMANQAAETGVRRAGHVVTDTVEGVAKDIAKRGVKAVWREWSTKQAEEYRRGIEVKHGPAKRAR